MIYRGSGPIELHHGGNKRGELWGVKNIRIRGVNLFSDKQTWSGGKEFVIAKHKDGTIHASGSGYYFYTVVMLNVHTTAITVSYNVLHVDCKSKVRGEVILRYTNGTYASRRIELTVPSRAQITINVESGKQIKFIEIRPCRKSDNKEPLSCTLNKIQVECGSEATPYEPYHNMLPGDFQKLISFHAP